MLKRQNDQNKIPASKKTKNYAKQHIYTGQNSKKTGKSGNKRPIEPERDMRVLPATGSSYLSYSQIRKGERMAKTGEK